MQQAPTCLLAKLTAFKLASTAAAASAMARSGTLTLMHALPSHSARVVHLIEACGTGRYEEVGPCSGELKDAGIDLSNRIEIKKIEFDDAHLMSEEYKKLNPLSTIPVLTDYKSVSINESCGILLYLLKFFGQGHLQPADEDAAGWAEFLNWMFRADTVLSAPLARWMMHSERSPSPVEERKPDIAEAAWKQALTGYQVLEDTLEGKKFLVNETFTAADIAVVYSAGFWVAMFPDMSTEPASKFPNIRMYNDRVMSRPAAGRAWAGFQPPPEACEKFVLPEADAGNAC